MVWSGIPYDVQSVTFCHMLHKYDNDITWTSGHPRRLTTRLLIQKLVQTNNKWNATDPIASGFQPHIASDAKNISLS